MVEISRVEKGISVAIGAANTDTSSWMNTSNRVFHLQSLTVTNLSAEAVVQLFDAGSAGWSSLRRVLTLKVGQGETIALGKDELVGAEFITGVWLQSTVTSGATIVRLGGYEE